MWVFFVDILASVFAELIRILNH